MPTRNVNLSEHLDRFIAERIEMGRFSNASEVVRERLRLLEQREHEDAAKLEWLRAAAREGLTPPTEAITLPSARIRTLTTSWIRYARK